MPLPTIQPERPSIEQMLEYLQLHGPTLRARLLQERPYDNSGNSFVVWQFEVISTFEAIKRLVDQQDLPRGEGIFFQRFGNIAQGAK